MTYRVQNVFLMLALVILYIIACFCCVGFTFFSAKSRDQLGRMSLLCVKWGVKPQHICFFTNIPTCLII